MIELLTRWPVWYQLLIAYTAVMGLWALRLASRSAATLDQTSLPLGTPAERGRAAGQRSAIWIGALGWFVAVALLLTGNRWALAVVAAGYALSARRTYRGFLRGRKSTDKLAAARGYVETPKAVHQISFILQLPSSR